VDRNEPQRKSDKLLFEEAISIHLQLTTTSSTEDAGQDLFLRRGLCLQETSGNIATPTERSNIQAIFETP
jgi:hypothetical protein